MRPLFTSRPWRDKLWYSHGPRVGSGGRNLHSDFDIIFLLKNKNLS